MHHVMGGIDGLPGAWGYAEGGNGAVSDAIAKSAKSFGAEIMVEADVENILTNSNGEACGVKLANGTEIAASVVLSNATPHVTYNHLLKEDQRKSLISEQILDAIGTIDYRSPVTKVNIAVDKPPNFLAKPNKHDFELQPHHQSTIHLNCEDLQLAHKAYLDAETECIPSRLPMIEMCMASALDNTLTEKEGHHVISCFTQYTPIQLSDGKGGVREWTAEDKRAYAEDNIFKTIDRYAPGFSDSVVGYDILTPRDLENIMGLTGGNIFHGAMSLDQLFLTRPLAKIPGAETPIKKLYIAGAGGHPGGGVMGSPGKLAAQTVLKTKF